MELIWECFTKKMFDFNGRASRKEFWLFFLTFLIIIVVIGSLEKFLPYYAYLMCIPLLITLIAVTVRRLHDTNRRGWFILLRLIPIVGDIWVTILLCLKGDEGPNSYGEAAK